jgi:hypothetical protein
MYGIQTRYVQTKENGMVAVGGAISNVTAKGQCNMDNQGSEEA